MDSFELAFTAWLSFLTSVGVDLDAVMNPPATVAEIEALEQTIGFELPTEQKALYRKTNGQKNPFNAIPAVGKYAVGLLGNYDFLSIEDALRSYQFQQEIREEYGVNMDKGITTGGADPVHTLYWKEGWLPSEAQMPAISR